MGDFGTFVVAERGRSRVSPAQALIQNDTARPLRLQLCFSFFQWKSKHVCCSRAAIFHAALVLVISFSFGTALRDRRSPYHLRMHKFVRKRCAAWRLSGAPSPHEYSSVKRVSRD